MSPAELVLGLLSAGARHGYEIKREHDARFPAAPPLAAGQVYATLKRLTRDGLVAEAGAEPGGGPERRLYELTPAGRERFEAWLARPEPPSPNAANALFAKVVLALLTGGSAADVLGRQRAAHMARMRELVRARGSEGASLSEVLSADYAVAHLDADLRWMELTAQRLDALTTEVNA